MAFSNNKIKFLQGTYENLNKMTSSEAGAFYITNDTHEMFLGVDSSKPPVALNRWVDIKQTWEEITKLSDYQNHPGKIYYALDKNILCTYNGTSWVQINPDTNTIFSSVSISEGEVYTEDNKQKLKYNLTFGLTDKNGTNINNLTATLVIDEDQIDSLVLDIKVGLTSTVDSNNIATIKTVGDGADTAQGVVTIVGAGGVTVSENSSQGNLKITGTTYDLTTANNTSQGALQLVDSSGGAKTVNFEGDTWIGVTSNNAGAITLTHKIASTGTEVTKNSASGVTIDKTSRKFKAITAAKADTNGHITSIEETEFTIPSSNFTLNEKTTALSGETNKTYTSGIELVDQNGGTVLSTANINTKHTIVVDGSKKIIENGGDLGTFYSKSAIDNKLKEIDAMVYKGIVDKEDNLPTVGTVKIGHTYKASTNFEMSDGRKISKGDLLIANGTETISNGEGFITGTIIWDHIESGADADTTYKIQGADNKIQLYNNVTGTVGSNVTASGDDWVKVSVADDNLKVEHKGAKAEVATNSSHKLSTTAFNVVTSVETDDKGHATKVNVTPVTIPELKFTNSVTGDPKLTITDEDGTVKSEIDFLDGDKIAVSGTINDKKISIKADHAKLASAPSNTTPNAKVDIPLDGSGTVSVLDGVIVDDYGHITGYKEKTINIAKETTYKLTAPAISSNVVTQVLEDQNATGMGNIKLSSDTLTYKVENDIIKADLLWGSF